MNNQTISYDLGCNLEKIVDDCIQCRKHEKRVEILQDLKKDIDKISDMKSYYYTYGSVTMAYILDILTADDTSKLIKMLNFKEEMLLKGGISI